MATTNKGLVQQAYNTTVGTLPANQAVEPTLPYSNWSVPINYDWAAIDLAFGGSVTISVTGVLTNQTMVLSQYMPLTIIFSGMLSQNLTYTLPSSVGGSWVVYNNTMGAFTLSMAAPSPATTVTIPSGGPYQVVCNTTSGISSVSLFDGTVTAAKLASNAVTTAKILDANVTIAKLETSIQQSFVPTGAVMSYAGATAPTGWVLCYGQSLSTTTYATLFAAIGYQYGGSGANFNVPDLRGRLAAGKDNMGGSTAARLNTISSTTLGGSGGEQTHILLTTELAAHQHFVAGPGGGTSGALSNANYIDYSYDAGNNYSYTLRGSSVASERGLTSATGANTAHNNIQPTLILNYIIKI